MVINFVLQNLQYFILVLRFTEMRKLLILLALVLGTTVYLPAQNINEIYVSAPMYPVFTMLNPLEVGIKCNREEKSTIWKIGLSYAHTWWSTDQYYDSSRKEYDNNNNIALGYQLKANEQLPIRQNSMYNNGLGVRIGLQKNFWVNQTLVVASFSINNFISYNLKKTSYGVVSLSDTIPGSGMPVGGQRLIYSYKNLHQTSNISYAPVLNFDIGVPFSLGDHWRLTPKLLCGISVFDRGKLDNTYYKNISGDAIITGSFSLSYIFKSEL